MKGHKFGIPSGFYKGLWIGASCISFVTACESNVRKLQRLREDAAVACLNNQYSNDCMLAQRELNRFMEGR